jgi:outer membrane protein assembly factor BamB
MAEKNETYIMKHIRNTILLIAVCTFVACQNNKFNYDPSEPYPELEVGERWDDKYDSRGLQNGIIKGNYLFVNTINISEGKDYLYCLNLVSKKVEWKNEVAQFASEPVCFGPNQVFYVSYVGNIYSFTLDGKKLWAIKTGTTFKEHKLNPENNNLVTKTISHEVFEFDKNSGHQVKHYFVHNLQILIY